MTHYPFIGQRLCCHFRWKRKEVHDIIVECAQLSIDLNEGVKEDTNKPILSTVTVKPVHMTHLNKYDQNIMSPKQFTSGLYVFILYLLIKAKRRKYIMNILLVERTVACNMLFILDASKHSVKVEPLPPGGKPLVSAEKMNKFWSPSLACGLATPPPSSSTQTFELPPSSHTHSQLIAPGMEIFRVENHYCKCIFVKGLCKVYLFKVGFKTFFYRKHTCSKCNAEYND